MFVASRRGASAGPGEDSSDGKLLSDGMKLSRMSKKQDVGVEGEKTSLENAVDTLKQGLFGVLFVMAKDAHIHPAWHFILVFFHFLQVRKALTRPLAIS